MLQALPTQLMFGRDAILNILFKVDWQLIRRCKEVLTKKDNECENVKRIHHTFNVGDKVLVTMDVLDRYSMTPYKSPYKSMKVNNNGTIKL